MDVGDFIPFLRGTLRGEAGFFPVLRLVTVVQRCE